MRKNVRETTKQIPRLVKKEGGRDTAGNGAETELQPVAAQDAHQVEQVDVL